MQVFFKTFVSYNKPMHALTSHSEDKPGDMTREDVLAAVRQKIALGIPVKRACEQVGVSRATYYRWEDEEREKAGSPQRDPASTSFEAGTSTGTVPEAQASAQPRAAGNSQEG